MDDDRELRDLMDLVGLVPHQLGGEPRSGAVAVLLLGSGSRRVLGPMIRVREHALSRADWPEALAAALADQLPGAEHLPGAGRPPGESRFPGGSAGRHGGAVVLLRYGRELELAAEPAPGIEGSGEVSPEEAGRLRDLGEAMSQRGLTMLAVIDIGAETARQIHPRPGALRSRAELASSPAATRLIVEGSAPGEEIEAAGRRVPDRPDSARRARFERARRTWSQLGGEGRTERRRALLRRWIDLADEAPMPGLSLPEARRVPADLCAASGVEAGDLAFRDAVLAILLSPEIRAAWDAVIRDGGQAPDPDPSRLPGLGPDAPDGRAAARARGLLQEWAALEAGAEAAAPLAMLAWIDWLVLRPEPARRRVAQASERDPACSLARLLDRALATGLQPRWAERVGEERNTRGTMER